MSFSMELRRLAEPIWQKEMEHPFVKGLASGELPLESFQYYLRQDYIYLIAFSRVFAIAAAKSHDLKEMGEFAELLHATLHDEMDLHRKYAAEFGISREELEATVPSPTAYAYTSHLVRTAYEGTMTEVLAAVLPCQWGYHEIGLRLAQVPGWESSPYRDWIKTYASPEFGRLAAMMRERLDALTASIDEAHKKRLQDLFLTSSRYEYLFWEKAYQREEWPV
ncbi:MAG: thiaminase II [Bacillus thermozeamaize]|jgi:thiaminase/transcriptional activator TenA|uniref:Aminopyrimidine aminohydrolase n=1 Tax=Bacillus thermozeamaize TaxID=230954 RepID=A0A1Y3PFK1_9BACI|nr:MAG: thiaminase II [Bacillus thermozeamaize]